MVYSGDLIDLRKRIRESRFSNEFEKNFCQSIFSYNAMRIMGDVKLNDLKRDVPLNVTIKQEVVLEKLIEKYKDNSAEGDLFEKYTLIFKEKGITLNSFDQRHLETFKGIFNESENFKKWINSI